MAHDKGKSLGVYDTAYEAAVARAGALGSPAPAQLPTAEAPAPAKKVDAMAEKVRQWYEAKWAAVEPWQTGSIAQQELRDRFCNQTGVSPAHLSVRAFDSMVKACFAGEVKVAARRCADTKVRSCWLMSPETACPAHLFEAWEEKRMVEVRMATERRREEQRKRE